MHCLKENWASEIYNIEIRSWFARICSLTAAEQPPCLIFRKAAKIICILANESYIALEIGMGEGGGQEDDFLESSLILEAEMTHFIGSFENIRASIPWGNEFHRSGPLTVLGLRDGLFLKKSISLKRILFQSIFLKAHLLEIGNHELI